MRLEGRGVSRRRGGEDRRALSKPEGAGQEERAGMLPGMGGMTWPVRNLSIPEGLPTCMKVISERVRRVVRVGL